MSGPQRRHVAIPNEIACRYDVDMHHVTPSYEQIAELPLTFESTVSEDWIDVMGHMNVARYTACFSSAMQGVRSSFGMNNEFVNQHQLGSFAIETHTRYLSELRVGKHLQVYSRILARSKSAKRTHQMHFLVDTERLRVATTFEAIVAIVDLQARRMTAMPAAPLTQLDTMLAQHQALAWSAPVCGTMHC